VRGVDSACTQIVKSYTFDKDDPKILFEFPVDESREENVLTCIFSMRKKHITFFEENKFILTLGYKHF
jgi:hypothetical protein